ncbi:MAG: nucleoside hydrolase [Bacteroidales bacterium]|nr:nucleoside hydrolase [Bacteroidales bacterium]
MKRIIISLLAFTLNSLTITHAQGISYGNYHQLRQPVPMILDTDFGSCTDDLFSLVMLYHYIEDGMVDLKGIIVDREGDRNAVLVDIFNRYYGHPDIPIALERNGVKNPFDFIPYSRLVDFRKPDGEWLYPRSIDPATLPEGYKFYRKLLSEADDNSVVVVAIGMMTCLSQLFESGADEFSPLDGVELFGLKVKSVYVQAGHFDGNDNFSGYNMRTASAAAAVFYDRLPSNVDLVLSPTNVGEMMDYTSEDILADLSYTVLHPIKTVYTQFDCEVGQRMWDTNCVVNAVLGDGEYNLSPRGRVKYIDRGEASQMVFTPDPDGNARYQLPGDSYFAAEKVMDIRRHTRMNRYPASCSIEAPQVQLTGADAAEWVRQRMDQLTDKYLGAAGNKLDPGEVLSLFRPLGFTGTNASDYSEAGLLLYMNIFDRMVQKALREGVSDLTIVMGPPSSGKSTAVRHLGLDKSGLICDGVPEGDGVLAAIVNGARKQGMDVITVVPVYNDIHSCLKNSLGQGRATGRYDGLDKLIEAYRGNEGQLQKLHREFPDIAIRPVDCSGNRGPRPASSAQALKWRYKVSTADIDGLLTALLSAVNNGEIGLSSLRAAAGDLYSIPGLGSKGRTIADTVNARIDEALKDYIQR